MNELCVSDPKAAVELRHTYMAIKIVDDVYFIPLFFACSKFTVYQLL